MRIKFMSVVRLPIYSTFHLSDICLTVELFDRKCSHVTNPICPTAMMRNIQVVGLKRFYFPTSHMSDMVPTHRASKNFSIFYSILILYLYLKMENNKKPLLSVTRQLIPCKTRLRGNFQLSQYKYCQEALLPSCSRQY